MGWFNKLFSKLAVDKTDIVRKILSKSNFDCSFSEKPCNQVEHTQTEKNKVPTIDCTNEYNLAFNYLTENWLKYTRYEEFLSLDENDRFPILTFIYECFNYHPSIIAKNLAKKYPQYEKKLLHFISWIESARIMRKVHNIRNKERGTRYYYITSHQENAELNNTIISIDDTDKINECWINDQGVWCRYFYTELFFTLDNYQKDLSIIKIFHNDKLHIFKRKDFIKYCEENGLNIKLRKTPQSKRFKNVLDECNIEYDKDTKLTLKFTLQKLKDKFGVNNVPPEYLKELLGVFENNVHK